MKQSNTSRYAYLAGLIDADGCIAIKRTQASKSNQRSTPSYSLQITVNQYDGRLIDWLYGNFGGNVCTCWSRLRNKNYYRWYITGSKAKYILKRLIPFLRYKKKQAELGIQLQTHIEKGMNGNSRWKSLSDKEIEIREKIYQESKELKQTFIPSAVVETKRSESSKKEDKR